MPATKSLRSGTCASTLFPTTRSAGPRSRRRRLGEIASEELGNRRNATAPRRRPRRSGPARCPGTGSRARRSAGAGSRRCSPTRPRDSRRPRAQTFDHRVRVPSGMLHPAIRVRREVRVLPEDLLAVHVPGQLDEQALPTDPHVQRVERLHPLHVLGGHERLAQGLGPKIDDAVAQWGIAEAAGDRLRPRRRVDGAGRWDHPKSQSSPASTRTMNERRSGPLGVRSSNERTPGCPG